MDNNKGKGLNGKYVFFLGFRNLFQQRRFSFYFFLDWGANLTPQKTLYHLGRIGHSDKIKPEFLDFQQEFLPISSTSPYSHTPRQGKSCCLPWSLTQL